MARAILDQFPAKDEEEVASSMRRRLKQKFSFVCGKG